MLLGHGGHLELHLYFLEAWADHEQFFQMLSQLVTQHQLLLLNKNYTALENRQAGLAPEESDFVTFCRAEYKPEVRFPRQVANKLSLKLRPQFVHNADQLLPTHQDVPILFGASRYKNHLGHIWFSAEMNRRMGHTPQNGRYGEQLIRLYVNIIEDLDINMAPDYAWIGEQDENMERISKENIMNKQVEAIFWGNYFSDPFLAKEQRPLFENTPIGLTKRLQNGLWYQLHERFEDVDEGEVETVTTAATEHFEPLNIKWLQWRFFPA